MQSILHKVIGPQEVHPENLHGRTAIVTGGALGIGFEVSRALAHAGCTVIMINRKEEQGDAAIKQVKEETPEADIRWKPCDLGNLSEVKSVFSSLREELDRLDFLVLCAGINANQYATDHDGIDRHFGVNFLGQVYAVNQLWPLVRKTSNMTGVTAPRVVFVSSEMHRTAPSDTKFESLEQINRDGEKIGPVGLYGRTKLAQILWVKYGLVERVIKPSSDNIYALSVHPGAVNTAMQEQWKDAYPGVTGTLLAWTMQAFGRDPEQGAYSTLWALTAPEITEKDQNGWYYSDPGQEGKESAQASDPELGAKLWNVSEKIIKDKLGQDALVDWSKR